MKPDKTGVGRWALVTGASHGIGYEFCRHFADDGFGVVLVARSADRLSEVAQEIEKHHHVPTLALPADLSDASAAEEVYSNVRERNIAVDILVNNAGFGNLGHFAEAEWEVQRQMLQVNVAALVELTRLFLPEMLRRRSGRILNVGSTGSFAPVPYMAVYGATKAFVLSFSEALSAELEGTGVTVTALCPGVTATQFARRAGTENTRLARMNKMTAWDVSRVGYQAMMNSRPRVVPGLFNKLLIGSLRFSHRNAVMKLGKLLLHP